MSRIILVGERRRVDLVLPSQEPVGRLLPEMLRVLDDQVGARPQTRHLVGADGSVLDPDATLESAGVVDGAVLRLVRVGEPASAPAVDALYDVTDEGADGVGGLGVRVWQWGPAAARGVAGSAVVAWGLLAAVLARQEFAALSVGVVLLLVAALAWGAGVLVGRGAKLRPVAATLVVAGGAVGVCGVWSLGDAQGWSGGARLAGVAGVVAAALLLLGWCSSLGRGGAFGAAAVVVGAGCWELALAVQATWHAGASIAVVSVVVLGVLPRFALTASGLSGLDDRRAGGTSVSRYQVATALAATHQELAPATVVTAASAAVGGVLVLRTVTVWTVLLAVAVAVVLGLRARAYPLVPEVVALLGAAAVVVGRLAWVWAGRGGAGGALVLVGALAAVPLGVLVLRPSEQVRARLRRFGELVESVGVIALFPLLIGVFGVYGRLLGTSA